MECHFYGDVNSQVNWHDIWALFQTAKYQAKILKNYYKMLQYPKLISVNEI